MSDGKRFQNGGQAFELVVDFNVRVESGRVVGGQLQIMLPGDVDNRFSANGAFEMAMEFGFGNGVVFWVEAFHEVRWDV